MTDSKQNNTSNNMDDERPSTQSSEVKKTGKGLSFFAILLSLAALAGTGFTWYQSQVIDVQQESKLSLGISEIGGQISRLGDSISRVQKDQTKNISQADLGAKVFELQVVRDKNLQLLRDEQGELWESVSKINESLTIGVNQYVLDEVLQLLRLANNNVQFGTNLESAINALSQADNQLKSLSDPRYASVRSIINDEVTQLRNVSQIDVEKLSSSLHRIAKIVPSLPLANEPPVQSIKTDAVEPEAAVTWRTELRILWQDVLSSVQIQRIDQPPKPLLIPRQRYFLNQNLQLSLAKAELAVMQGEVGVFERSINDSLQWIDDYFDVANPQVSSVLSQLHEIAEQPMNSEIPSITGSYQALQTIQRR